MAYKHISKRSVIRCMVLMLILQGSITIAMETLVKMDKEEVNNKCGQVFVLNPSHEVRMTSKGMAPDGYCGVTVYTPRTVDNYTCDALCVTYKTASISTCDVKVKFIGHVFGKNGDQVREFNCHHPNRESFCWNVNSMRVEVIETYDYAYKWNKALYEFDLDVSARCTKDSIARRLYHATRARLEEDEKQTYIEGIAVGVSLACVFLVILFIMWCYTKHQAVARSPSSNNGEGSSSNTNKKKGHILSTFRAKLHIGRKHGQPNDETVNQEKATYRKTSEAKPSPPTNDPEAATELSPLKSETKDADGDTYELASETPITENDTSKDGGQDSPKDGGMEEIKLTTPEVIIVPGTPEPPETP